MVIPRITLSSLTFSAVLIGLTADLAAQCSSAPRPRSPTLSGRSQGNTSAGAPTTPSPGSPAGPSTPSSPGPGGPTTPGASDGPSTPRAAGPSTPGGFGPTTGGVGGPVSGGAIEFVRGDTSSERLQVDWDYPVPEHAALGQAMSFQRAIEAVRGDDPRPLLILRECETCAGSSRALLDEGQNDERTKLMTRWFHCIKLPNHVWDPSHPFYELFRDLGPAHLFLATWDGSKRISFPGVQPRAALWRAMYDVLDDEYEHDAKSAVGKLVKQLDVYDRLDSRIKDATVQFDRALENHGPSSARYKKAENRLMREKTALERAESDEQRIADLGLARKKEAPIGDSR